jgi:hypothetical protein
MKIFSLIITLLFILFISCEKDESSLGFEPGPPGSYSYQAYDSLGNLIVGGWLSFEFTDSVGIEGTWNLKNLTDRNDLGPQIGDGILKGGSSDSRIWMELNPQFRDNNLHLEGTTDDDRIEGTWAWLTFAGVSNWGTFKAIKN